MLQDDDDLHSSQTSHFQAPRKFRNEHADSQSPTEDPINHEDEDEKPSHPRNHADEALEKSSHPRNHADEALEKLSHPRNYADEALEEPFRPQSGWVYAGRSLQPTDSWTPELHGWAWKSTWTSPDRTREPLHSKVGRRGDFSIPGFRFLIPPL